MEIFILGEANESRPARRMIRPALEHAAFDLGINVSCQWRQNGAIDLAEIRTAHGIFVAPGSPGEGYEKIIEAIRLAREDGIPCLGTCGGFQRMIAEYALKELSYERIEHEEVMPSANNPLFSELSCSLTGQRDKVFIAANSLALSLYEKESVEERFFCHYGLSGRHKERIQSKDLKVSAYDKNGEARIIEHTKHLFFFGTLFVPQVSSTRENPHPVIAAFVEAAEAKAG
ncbi:MAG: CTP synthase [Verrucomicrobiota bacterium]